MSRYLNIILRGSTHLCCVNWCFHLSLESCYCLLLVLPQFLYKLRRKSFIVVLFVSYFDGSKGDVANLTSEVFTTVLVPRKKW